MDERVERFAEKIERLVVIDPRRYPLNGIDDAFLPWIMAPRGVPVGGSSWQPTR